MDRGLLPPCLELGNEPEPYHTLLWWAERKTNRNTGLVRLCGSNLEYWSGKEVPGAGPATWAFLVDADYVERVTIEGTYTYRALVVCGHPGGNPQTLTPPASASLSYRGAMSWASSGDCSTVPATPGVKSESAQKPGGVISLAHHYFPEVVEGAGIPMNKEQINGAGLVRVLRSWKAAGISTETMKLMMEEFVRHPDWCRHSQRNPWQVFASHKEELAGLLAHRKRKDPANRRWSTGKDDAYWLSYAR